MPRLLTLLSFLTLLVAAPVHADTHASDDIAQSLSHPKFTPQQQAFLREMADDPDFSAKVANFFGITQPRFFNQGADTQACYGAQYLAFQDISRSRWSSEAKAFAKENLKRTDWCFSILRTLNQTVSQVTSYDGLVTLYYVIYRDMELRLRLVEKDVGRERTGAPK